MKKILGIIYGGNQLLFAAQVRHTLFKNDRFDIIYGKINIDENGAREIFDHVFKCKRYGAPPKIEALRCFFNPKYAIKTFYADIELDLYTDIIFFGPEYIHYFLYKYSCYKKKHYHWHLIPEGAGVYLIDKYSAGEPPKYGHQPVAKMISLLDNRWWKYTKMTSLLVEDAFLIQAKYALGSNNFSYVDVPIIDRTDKVFVGKLNNMFCYKPEDIANKIIILDGGLSGSRKDGTSNIEMIDAVISRIGNLYGSQNVLLKRKHGISINEYGEDVRHSVTFYEDENMPWELVCLNENIKECVVVGVMSSAIILPFIMCGFEQPTYVFTDEFQNAEYDEDFYSPAKQFIKEVTSDMKCFNEIKNEDVLQAYISDFGKYCNL